MNAAIKKIEKYKILVISLLIIVVANAIGFTTSFKRKRDIQRIVDMGHMETGLYLYRQEFGYFPPSENGKIKACIGDKTDLARDANGKPLTTTFKKPAYVNLVVCNWGDTLLDPGDINYPHYIDRIPTDPLLHKGVSYYYESNGESFRILGHLELAGEHRDYVKDLEEKKIKCGNKYCNFGRSSKSTLLDGM